MKKVHVNEDKCLGCRLCEYWCAFAHSGEKYMPDAFNLTKPPVPRIVVEEKAKLFLPLPAATATTRYA